MKTRILNTTLWEEESVLNLSKDGKVLLFYLLSAGFLGFTRYAKLPAERLVLTATGLNRAECEKAKAELATCDVYFHDGWVYQVHHFAYFDYEGRDRVNAAREKELSAIPADILTSFEGVTKGLKRGYEPTINHKSKTKPEIRGESAREEEMQAVLVAFNETYQTHYTATKAISENYRYWRECYTVEDMVKAVKGSRRHPFWKDKLTPDILLRQKDKNGQKIDRIAECRELYREPVAQPSAQPFVPDEFVPASEVSRSLVRGTLEKITNIMTMP